MAFLSDTLLFLGLTAVLFAVSLAPLLIVVYGVSWLITRREAALALKAGVSAGTDLQGQTAA